MPFSNRAACGGQKSRIIYEKVASGLFLGNNSSLKRVHLLGAIFQRYKINEMIKNFISRK